MPQYRSYPIPPYGYGPQFAETERPPAYASQLRNRFVNSGGGAEARPGLRRIAVAPGSGKAQGLGEIVRSAGSTRMVTIHDGKVLLFDHNTSAAAADAFVTAYDSLNSTADYYAKIVQLDDKLIIAAENDRPITTRTGRSYIELTPLIVQGNAQSKNTAHDSLYDTDVSSWALGTDVANNDLMFDTTTSAYALVLSITGTSGRLTHTPLTAAAQGLASGKAAKNAGDHYEILDLVELNIIPTPNDGDPDNVAVARTGTDASTVFVSSNAYAGLKIDWRLTDLRVGDYISNTTRNQVAKVKSFDNSAIRVTDIQGQNANDSLVFLKSAVPQASYAHVHFNRLYLVDARDKKQIRISGPNDPRDFTTFAGTLDATTFRFGAQQPEGDEVQAMQTFQRYLLIGGKRHVYLFDGADPIADASSDSVDFKPTSMFPQGVIGPDAVAPTGNDIIFCTPDGLNAASIPYSNLIPTRNIMSQSLRDELADQLVNASARAVSVVHYSRRSWVMVRVASSSPRVYNFNYAPNLLNLTRSVVQQNEAQRGSFSVFDGPLATQRVYFTRSTGTLWTADASGGLWRFDDPGQTIDSPGSAFAARVQTAWLGLDEGPTGVPSRKRKAGIAIMPTFQLPANHPGATYNITVSAPYENQSGETQVVNVGTASVCGQGAFAPRLPFRWTGERMRLTIENTAKASAVAGDVIAGFTVEYNERGIGR